MLHSKQLTWILMLMPLSAGAETLIGPLHGNTLKFAERSVSIYYTVSNDVYEVVSTVGPKTDGSEADDSLLRFVARLHDNEQHCIVLGGYGANQHHASLILKRTGDAITATVEERPAGNILSSRVLD